MNKRIAIYFLFFLPALSSTAQAYILKGSIKGYDDKLLKMAHIYLLNNRDTVAWVQVDKSGNFELRYSTNKKYTLMVSGVHHRTFYGDVYPFEETTKEVKIRLGTFTYNNSLETLMAVGDFNNFSVQEHAIKIPVTNNKGEVKVDKTMKYGLANLSQGKLISGVSEKFIQSGLSVGGDGYLSVLEKGQRIQFDLAQYPPSNIEAKVLFKNPVANKMSEISREIDKRERDFSSKVMAIATSGNDKFEPIDLTTEYEDIEKRIDSETDQAERQALLIQYVALEAVKTKFILRSATPGKSMSFFKGSPKEKYVIAAVTEISPLSPLWMVTREVVVGPLAALPGLMKELQPFYHQLLINSTDDYQRAAALKALAMASFKNNDELNARNYFGQLRSEYPGSSYIETIRSEFGIKDNNEEIKDAPEFSVPLVNNRNEFITEKSLKGKFYIIDFWSTGCGGCILEMPNLHNAYQKFKSKNLEILSVALNPTVQMTKDFQSKTYPMPWINVQPDNSFASKIAKAFYVDYLPRIYLINPEGKIIAQDSDLKGERLESTLSKYLK